MELLDIQEVGTAHTTAPAPHAGCGHTKFNSAYRL